MRFYEELLPGCLDYGSAVGAGYAVDITVDAADNTYVRRRHPYPVKRFECGYTNKDYDLILRELVAMFHRVGGMAGGFRFYDRQEFSTNQFTLPPTAADQFCQLIDLGASTWQIMRFYDDPSDPNASRRRIRKPREGTVIVGIYSSIADTVTQTTDFTIDHTRGIITMGPNRAAVISNINQATQATITFTGPHGFLPGDSIGISNVEGMTQINGRRVEVISIGTNTVLVNINTTGFSPYTSGGGAATGVAFGEIVTAGCYFDIPVRFETDLSGVSYSNLDVLTTMITLVEILNPDPQ
jgi:uncharacterized protein (TIGR02217 family)